MANAISPVRTIGYGKGARADLAEVQPVRSANFQRLVAEYITGDAFDGSARHGAPAQQLRRVLLKQRERLLRLRLRKGLDCVLQLVARRDHCAPPFSSSGPSRLRSCTMRSRHAWRMYAERGRLS